MKVCKDCGESKSLSDYYMNKGRYPFARCKPCHISRTTAHRHANPDIVRLQGRKRYAADPGKQRDKKRWLKYGLTRSEYDALLEVQDHVCPVCLVGFAPDSRTDWLAPVVDHDHETGAVRGILHRRCNLALEFLLPEAADARARAYLEGDTDVRRTA